MELALPLKMVNHSQQKLFVKGGQKMHPYTLEVIDNVMKSVEVLLEFNNAVDVEFKKEFPDLTTEFALTVDGMNDTAIVDVTLNAKDEAQRLKINDFVDANKKRWDSELTAKTAGITTAILRIK